MPTPYSAITDLQRIMPSRDIIELTNSSEVRGSVNGNIALGQTSINFLNMDTPSANETVIFGNHLTVYTISSPTASSFTVTPALTAAIVNGESIYVINDVDNDVYEQARDDADSMIDAFTASLDFSVTTPDIIRRISTVLTKKLLYDKAGRMSEDLYRQYQDMIDLLKQMNRAEIQPKETGVTQRGAYIYGGTSPAQVLTDDRLEDNFL